MTLLDTMMVVAAAAVAATAVVGDHQCRAQEDPECLTLDQWMLRLVAVQTAACLASLWLQCKQEYRARCEQEEEMETEFRVDENDDVR